VVLTVKVAASAVGSIKFRRLCGERCHNVKTEATTIKDQNGAGIR